MARTEEQKTARRERIKNNPLTDIQKKQRAAYDKERYGRIKMDRIIQMRKYDESHKDECALRRKCRSREIKAYDKKYRDENKDRLSERHKITSLALYALNRKAIIAKTKKYRSDNIDKINEKLRLKTLTDPNYKFSENIRSLIRRSFKCSGFNKTSRTAEILGCTYEIFREYIESQFESWMSFDNYGNWNGIPKERNVAWDLDHKEPISLANNKDDVVRLNHYTNFQPLCSYENRWIKRNKLEY